MLDGSRHEFHADREFEGGTDGSQEDPPPVSPCVRCRDCRRIPRRRPRRRASRRGAEERHAVPPLRQDGREALAARRRRVSHRHVRGVRGDSHHPRGDRRRGQLPRQRVGVPQGPQRGARRQSDPRPPRQGLRHDEAPRPRQEDGDGAPRGQPAPIEDRHDRPVDVPRVRVRRGSGPHLRDRRAASRQPTSPASRARSATSDSPDTRTRRST